ncbi:MAG: DUF2975 domain-containing protein [Rikenellaceae bacterium]|nr:DUF2975 domain-containing protein [Rikenellaceae bacterium]
MQNKRTYLKRLLAIYVAFFAVLIGWLALEVAPDFSQGIREGTQLGNELDAEWAQNTPKAIYEFWEIPVKENGSATIETTDSMRRVEAHPASIMLKVSEPLGDRSTWWVAFASTGGSPWVYLFSLLSLVTYIAIIVLMWLIIRSVRRSIREEQPLAKINVWRLRAIALLAIATDLIARTANWLAARNAAKMLVGSDYQVNTAFDVGFETLVVGLLILFAAEVLAIGRDLGEEQRLTI